MGLRVLFLKLFSFEAQIRAQGTLCGMAEAPAERETAPGMPLNRDMFDGCQIMFIDPRFK